MLARTVRYANVAQSVERIHGKDEVRGSIPRVGSTFDQSGLHWSEATPRGYYLLYSAA